MPTIIEAVLLILILAVELVFILGCIFGFDAEL